MRLEPALVLERIGDFVYVESVVRRRWWHDHKVEELEPTMRRDWNGRKRLLCCKCGAEFFPPFGVPGGAFRGTLIEQVQEYVRDGYSVDEGIAFVASNAMMTIDAVENLRAAMTRLRGAS